MTIYKQETIPYDDGTERVIYSFPSLKDCNDLKKFMVLLESICGKIDEMIITNCTSDDETISFYKRYDDLPDFLDNFNLQNIREYNTYTFTGCDKNHKFKTHLVFTNVMTMNLMNPKKTTTGIINSKMVLL